MAELFKRFAINRGDMLGEWVPFLGFYTNIDETGQRCILSFAKGFLMPELYIFLVNEFHQLFIGKNRGMLFEFSPRKIKCIFPMSKLV